MSKLPPAWARARAVFLTGVSAASPYAAVKRSFRITGRKDPLLELNDTSIRLKDYKNIYVIGAGKGVSMMAKAVEEALGGFLTSGTVVTKYGHSVGLERITEVEAGHPLPDRSGVKGAHRILRLARSAAKDDLVVCLITGRPSTG